jgi:hypothetical protein
VQQIRRATQRVADMEQPADQRGHSLQRPPLVLIPAPGRRALIQFSAQPSQLRRAQSAYRPARAPRRQRRSAAARQRRRHWYADFVPTRNR